LVENIQNYIFPQAGASTFLLGGATQRLNLKTAIEISSHIKILEDFETATEITLSGNSIGKDAGKSLAAALNNQIGLKKLLMASIFTTVDLEGKESVLEDVFKALKGKPIELLDLSNNALGCSLAVIIASFLSNNATLTSFLLNNSGLAINGGKIIAQALKGKYKLETIDMGSNFLEDQGATAVSASLKEMKCLRVLRLPNNSISYRGLHGLVMALEDMRSLEHLDLHGNSFIKMGGDILEVGLDRWPNIRVLNLGFSLFHSFELIDRRL
jgi:Ran GTPase-activating protein (RanGAP) involved in mRNA processing and transport